MPGLFDTITADPRLPGLLGGTGPQLTPDQRRKLAARALTAQFDRATPQDTEVVERASMFPLGTYANGMTGPAIPGFIYDGLFAPGNALSGKLGNYQDNREEWAKAGFDTAGAAMVGGLAAPKPSNTVGIFGGRLAKTADNAAGERPGIGHNRPPPTVNINGREVELDPSRLSRNYASHPELNEQLLQNGGNIDSEIAWATKELALRQKNLADGQPWATPERVAQAKEYLDTALNYKSGLGRATVDETPVENMPFGSVWYHATNARPFDQFMPSPEGAVGPGVYVGRDKTQTKSIIPDSEKYSGEGPRRVLSVQHRGNLMPYNDYLSLAESIAGKSGVDSGSTEMSQALAPILRRYGYSGVMDNSGDYGRYAAIFDPADTKIVAQELYANGGRPGAAVGATANAQDQDPSNIKPILDKYGLGHLLNPTDWARKMQPGDA